MSLKSDGDNNKTMGVADTKASLADALATLLPQTILPPHMAQTYAATMAAPEVAAAECTFFRACVALQAADGKERENFWDTSSDWHAQIYRAVVGLNMPQQQRGIVPGAAGGIARGRCYGLGAGRDKTPYVKKSTAQANELLKMVRGSIAATNSSFTYTSVQIHVNGR